jgi:hypothetical protein
MTTLIIGSSNVERHYKDVDKEVVDGTIMERCTKMEVFRVLMSKVREEIKVVIISVVENFLSDAVGGERNSDAMARTIDGTMKEYLDVVESTATRLPNTAFALVEPMRRPGLPWYEEKVENIIDFHNRCVNNMRMKNVGRIAGLMAGTQIFDSFGVHLIPSAGVKFVEMIVLNADDLVESMSSEVVDVEMIEATKAEKGMSKKSVEDKVVASDKIPVVVPESLNVRKTKTVEERLDDVEADIRTRRINDNMVFARIREEQDYQINEKKEDRVFITGMTSEVSRPSGEPEARAWIKEIVADALDKIIPDSGKMIQFVSMNKNQSGVPNCEVKLKEKEWAARLRKTFGKMRKEGKVEGRIFLTNCVTMGTRVRLEILRAIARKCSNAAVDMFVMGFSSRPVLQVKRKDGGNPMVLTFVDAVAKYGKLLKETDLGFAYERAGTSFSGQMSQNFIVLTDANVITGPRGGGRPGPPKFTGGNKRALERGEGQSSLPKRQSGKKTD